MWASRVEKQAKVVNEVSTVFLETFKAHVHDLEDAMIALANTPTKEAALEVEEMMWHDAPHEIMMPVRHVR